MTTIHTKKFTLRPFRKGDEISLRKNINDRKIARYTLTIPYPYTMKDARFWVSQHTKGKRKDKMTFVIDIGGEVAGSIGLSRDGHKAEMGYWLGINYWGQGIMTQAVKRVMHYGFSELGLRRIYAGVFPANKASAKVLEKAGLKLEGLVRKNHIKNSNI